MRIIPVVSRPMNLLRRTRQVCNEDNSDAVIGGQIIGFHYLVIVLGYPTFTLFLIPFLFNASHNKCSKIFDRIVCCARLNAFSILVSQFSLLFHFSTSPASLEKNIAMSSLKFTTLLIIESIFCSLKKKIRSSTYISVFNF